MALVLALSLAIFVASVSVSLAYGVLTGRDASAQVGELLAAIIGSLLGALGVYLGGTGRGGGPPVE